MYLELWKESDEYDNHRLLDSQRKTQKESLRILQTMKKKYGVSTHTKKFSHMRNMVEVTFYFKRSDYILVIYCTEKQSKLF